MAAKDLNTDDIKKQELDDITTCCICTGVYTDPKALPCIHTFCLKCIQAIGLKTNKRPGAEMPCPICRRLFKIPEQGFHGLPKNFFIERLIEVANLSHQPESSIPLCDACVEENEDAHKEISAADSYCVDCNQKFCQECCKHHRKLKLTKHHRLIPMTEHESGQNVMTNIAPSVCELHQQKVLDIYCTDCKTVICAICFIDGHKNHDGSHVDKFVDGFRKQIESNVEAINECRSKAETKKSELLKVKEGIQGKVENLESDVATREDELIQFAVDQVSSLLQGLYTIRQRKLKEIQMATDDIDAYLWNLETYNSICQQIVVTGSAENICRTFSDLSVRAVDLQQQCELMIERDIQFFDFHFRKSQIEEFLKENCCNLIGEIEEDGNSKSRKRFDPSLLSQQSNEIERLREEVKSEITYRESLRLEIAQLRITMNKENRANKVFIEELTQKLDATIVTNKSLLDQNDKLKQELESDKKTNNVQASSNQFIQEVNAAYKTINREFEDDVKEPKQELEIKKTVEVPYRSEPVLLQTIATKAVEENKRQISGLAILDKELFVVSRKFSEVEVYDLMGLTFICRWHLKELIDPLDLVSCRRNKCLFIFNYRGRRNKKHILRVDPNGNLIKSWSTVYDWGWSLSVTYESNILLTMYNGHMLKEYSPDGQFIREINLLANSGLRDPWHAIKLNNGHFLVSVGLNCVCMVDEEGKLLKSVSLEHDMKRPVYLSADGNGFFMVADQLNSRVLFFDSDLQFKKEILSKQKHGLQHPWRILLDESNGRLIVGHNSDLIGRILVFDLKL